MHELLQEYGPCLILIDGWVAYARQFHDKEPEEIQTPDPTKGGETIRQGPWKGTGTPPPPPPPATQPKRYHGTATLDANRVGRDAGRIAEEVIAHLWQAS